MPDVPPPEELETPEWEPPSGIDPETLPPWPFESRPANPDHGGFAHGGDPLVWERLRGPLPDNPRLHTAALVYQSDAGSFAGVARRHGDFAHGPSASLDHAFWIHRPFRWDDWVLAVTDSPVAYAARALSLRQVYSRDGLHIATMAQECVFRAPRPGS
jgi:acyl-CoA thioesterase II